MFAEQKLRVGGEEVVTLRRMPPASSVYLLKFGRVYSPTDIDVPANSELISWGKVRSDESEDWIGMVEITEEVADRPGLLGCATVVTCRQNKRIPVRVVNILSDPIRVRKGQSLANCIEASVVTDAVNKLQDADADDNVSVTSGVTIGTVLSAVDKQRVDTLLDKYRDVFASPGKTGCCTIVEHTITTDEPITCRPRRLPMRWKLEIDEEVQRLHDQDIIRPSISAYAAPICPVRKKDGSLRLCVDYRALNTNTKSTAIPTGNLIEVVESIWQVPIFLVQ